MNKEKYERQQQQLEANIDNLKASADDPDVPPQTNDFVEHFKHHGNIDALTRPLLTELIDHINVKEKNDIEIVFRFHDAFKESQLIAESKSA